VFEPNDYKLWARVKQTVTLFLRTQWREGALLGLKEEEAFSVSVGRETMTEDDILNGRLIIEVGIAPVRPAEFVIFRVFQKTQEAKS
jgi:phage tail sheath protein FI